MFTLKVIQTFSAAHNLRDYQGKCERLHGHNWKVEVEVKGKKLGRAGLLIDFHDLKKELEKVLVTLDHECLNELPPFDKLNPTSENLAKYIFESLTCHLSSVTCHLSKVTVWESDNACASYTEK